MRATKAVMLGLVIWLGTGTASVRATETSGAYPNFNISVLCRFAVAVRGERMTDCEDREYAVALILRRDWNDLMRTDPVQVAACADRSIAVEERPSYLALLQCITGVRDAAD